MRSIRGFMVHGRPPNRCTSSAPNCLVEHLTDARHQRQLYGRPPTGCTASAPNCMVDHLMETQPWRQLYGRPHNGCTALAPIVWSTTQSTMVEREWRLLFDKNILHVILTTFDLFYSLWRLMSLGAFYGAVVLLRMATRFSM